uniref:Large ribosomal subunit protein eL24-related N-terminal domain-containing protein n=1 Tax=Chenopodium quinoa TaxID=63459 RepID=A0A803N620_CHEQI
MKCTLGLNFAALVVQRYTLKGYQVFLFVNSKCKIYFHNRLKPAKFCWTTVYRKQHKKDIFAEAVKKKRRPQRSIM